VCASNAVVGTVHDAGGGGEGGGWMTREK